VTALARFALLVLKCAARAATTVAIPARNAFTSPGVILKRTVISAAVLALGLAGVGVAGANPPGPNGNNTFGLCTAYFSGSENGQQNKRKAPPFQGLEAAAEAEDMTVGEYCREYGQQPGNGGGNGGGKGGGN
jgi:hypothetical protein